MVLLELSPTRPNRSPFHRRVLISRRHGHRHRRHRQRPRQRNRQLSRVQACPCRAKLRPQRPPPPSRGHRLRLLLAVVRSEHRGSAVPVRSSAWERSFSSSCWSRVAALVGGSSSTSKTSTPHPSNQAAGGSGSSTPPPTTASRQDIQIVQKGFSQLQPDSIGNSYVTYAIVVQNPNTSGWVANYVSFNISLVNAAGVIVKVDTPTLRTLLPGQKAAIAPLITQASGVVRMDVQANVSTWLTTASETGGFTFSNITTTPQQYGGVKTTATLSSTFASQQSLVQATAVYYDAAGNIIGGALTYVDVVPPGGQVPVEITASTAPPSIARTEVYGAL